MVFQNVYLFHDTIRANICFGKPDASEAEMIAAAKKAQCHDFIIALPNGYDTVVGEGGGSFSGGEKQRISIARAILKDAPIIILDEATASVAPENEHLIQQAISELTRGKTIITIAHRRGYRGRHADLRQAGVGLDAHDVSQRQADQQGLDDALNHDPEGVSGAVEIADHAEQHGGGDGLRGKALEVVEALLDHGGVGGEASSQHIPLQQHHADRLGQHRCNSRAAASIPNPATRARSPTMFTTQATSTNSRGDLLSPSPLKMAENRL